MGFNGWLAVVGPGSSQADRQLSQVLACTYVPHNAWLCPHCHSYLHSTELHYEATKAEERYQVMGAPSGIWFHAPCHGLGPITPAWANDHALTTILYAYHGQRSNRPEVHDDIRKLLIFGKKVVILAHGLDGLEHIAPHVYGVLCPSVEAETALQTTVHQNGTQLRVSATVPLPLPMLPPAPAGRVVEAQYLVGWHGRWQPERNVHALIEAVAALRADGLDVGLVAAGGYPQLGLRPPPSGLAYFWHCQRLVDKLGLTSYCSLAAREFSWAELVTTLSGCTLFCLPTVSAAVYTRSAAALTCLAFKKPTLLSDLSIHKDGLVGAIPLGEVTGPALAGQLRAVLDGKVTSPEHAVMKVNATHSPVAIQYRYLGLIRAWTT